MNHLKIDWHAFSVKEIFTKLESGEQGLTSYEANNRKKIYGYNRLRSLKKRSATMRFLTQFHNVLIYILLVSAIITALLSHWIDTSVIIGVVVLNAIIGFIQEGKAEKALDAIREMLSPKATVVRDGIRQTIAARSLVPGDIVLLQSGDKVPADLRLFDVHSLQVQEASLTGESIPVTKKIPPVEPNTNLGDRKSMAYSSTLVAYGRGMGIVVETGENTEIGRISSMIATVPNLTTPLLRQMTIFGRWLTAAIILMSIVVFAVGAMLWGDTSTQMFMAAVAIAVAAIPEGLPAIITITLAISVTRMAKRNAIIRRLPAVETMGAVSTICTDKTGTLTRSELAVQNAVSADHVYFISGSGYNDDGQLCLNNKPLEINNHNNLREAILAGVLCNDSELTKNDSGWHLEGNPTDGALLALGLKAQLDLHFEKRSLPLTDLIPFESINKFMASLHHDHQGNGYIYIKGAPEKILAICNKERGQKQDTDINIDYWNQYINTLAEKGQRVVAIAVAPTTNEHRNLTFEDLEREFTLLGLFGLIDPPRTEVPAAVAECKRAGIDVKMITGDHKKTAITIAEQIGISNGKRTLTGQEINNLDDKELAKLVPEIDIYARTSPEHKLRLVRALQSHGKIVAMTGDGVNDAPALKQAEIGVAMGQRGTEATKEVAEMVLADDNFASITHAVEEGRTVYENIKKAILYILPTNMGEAFSVIMAILLGYTLPITAVQILWVNMVSAVTLALALGFEKAETNIMKKPPRPAKEPILSPFLLWRIFFVSILLTIAVFGLFIFESHIGVNLATARTVAINMLVAGEIVYLINCRKIYSSALNLKAIFGSAPVLIAIGCVTIFQLIFTYTPFMQHFFGSAAINFQQWLHIIVFAILVFLLVEAEKALMRKIKSL